MLEDAGIAFRAMPSHVDETVLKATLAGVAPGVLAASLAEAKAAAIAAVRPDDWIIGADQVLACEEQLYDKPADRAAARAQLQALRGRTHVLHTAACLMRGDTVFWAGIETPGLTMRAFTDAFLDAYLDREGDAVLSSVGAYRVEGPGIQLFDRIDGDQHAIRGLPMLGLLAALRSHGVVAS